MITRYIADTHAVIWYVYGDPRLSATVKRLFESVANEPNQIGVSAISMVEIVYLEEKGRVPSGTFAGIAALLSKADSILIEVPVTRIIAQEMFQIVRIAVPDMPDRIIAGTALALGLSLITADAKIRASNVPTIW